MMLLYILFKDTATPEIYTLSLHDALPIYQPLDPATSQLVLNRAVALALAGDGTGLNLLRKDLGAAMASGPRSEEQTSELQSRHYLVCRLLLVNTSRTKSAASCTRSRKATV